ncbi:hypothetical protein AB7179_00385 [Providencia manganoxydans]|uniref:hypothetical protein n=1 Tax=Providencia manganoxydans TaxID=2923283 RepID=UPI0034E50AED
MKKGLALGILVVSLIGCGEKDPKYDGEYSCKLINMYNDMSRARGLKSVFPEGTEYVTISINNRVVIVNGMENGSFSSPQLEEMVDEKGMEYLSGERRNTSVSFARELGNLQINIDSKPAQILANCKLQ